MNSRGTRTCGPRNLGAGAAPRSAELDLDRDCERDGPHQEELDHQGQDEPQPALVGNAAQTEHAHQQRIRRHDHVREAIPFPRLMGRMYP